MAVLKVIPADKTEPVRTSTLISGKEALPLARLFKIFANEMRLRLLHKFIRKDRLCVGDLSAALEMKPQAVSNQLPRLMDRGILSSRREGTSIFYPIVDPFVPVFLERGLCLIECVPESVEQSRACCDETGGTCRENGAAAPMQKAKSRMLYAKMMISRRGTHLT